MDQKHAMLYPPITRNAGASADMGLPQEAPPSYDAAMSSGPEPATTSLAPTDFDWRSSGGADTPDFAQLDAQQSPQMPRPVMQPFDRRNNSTSRSFMVVPKEQALRHLSQPNLPPPPLQLQQQHIEELQPYYDQQLPAATMMCSPLGPNPCTVTCPACGANKTTRMSFTPNTRTHLCALLLCVVGWCCCACCVPYCMTSCRTGNHYCAQCNTFLGSYNAKDV